ncbi:tetratricopeptide repeat protein [Stella sp.]|uniref:tetratricopeptide repeat protein n=1 Tax=Stella sp. TaxID=2912054 RepID=UPI0035B21CB2
MSGLPPAGAADPAAIRRLLAEGSLAAACEAAQALADRNPDDPAGWLLLAKALVARSRADEAAAALDRAAALGPLPPDGKSDLAAVRLLRADIAGASALIAEAIAGDPDNVVAWRRRALVEERAGNAAAAEDAYRRALALAPDDAALHNNHGIFLRGQGRNEDAAAALRQAIALEPHRVEYRANYAATLRLDGRAEPAIQAYREAIRLAPAREDLRLALIAVLRAVGRAEPAIAAAREGAAAIPRSGRLAVALSATLLDAGQAEEARAAAEEALERQPTLHEAWLHLGNALRIQERRAEAADAYRRLLAAQPNDVQALANLALVLMELGDVDAARPLAARAVELAPRNADALHVAGTVAEVAGDLAEAERHFRAAAAARPGFAEADFSLGWLLMSEGRFRDGQPGFDRRWQLPRFDKWRRPHRQPLWDGSALAGRKLLVWGDHGPGDEIMYSRLVPAVAAAGGTVLLECEPRLAPLFARAFPTVTVVPRSDPPAAAAVGADLQCPTGSLPGRLHAGPASLPREPIAHLLADAPRARALRERYRDGRLLVGLSWHSRHPGIGTEKSLPLAGWTPILQTPGCRFVSIQYGDHGAELAEVGEKSGVPILVDPEIDPLRDFDAAAAQIAALDLVVSISNTAAHLSAALGVPTWMMVPKGRGLFWYWLLERADSPWYPSLRLYRQTAAGDWSGVIGRIAADLAALR